MGKLRPVLDYMPCETCLDMYTPEQDYFCAICVRLTRDVVVRRAAVGTDEAVQVIAPEDFSMAKDLRDRIQQQELELQEAREKLSSLSARVGELQLELKRFQEELERARKERDDAGLVPFEFVGVKNAPGEDIIEFTEEGAEPSGTPQPLAWEPAPEESREPVPSPEETASPEPAPGWEPAPQGGDEDMPDEDAEDAPTFQSGPEMMEQEPPARGSQRRQVPSTADDAIARIEAEIAKIEQELQQVADQEKGLAGQGGRRRRRK